jgi:hypothetical protein
MSSQNLFLSIPVMGAMGMVVEFQKAIEACHASSPYSYPPQQGETFLLSLNTSTLRKIWTTLRDPMVGALLNASATRARSRISQKVAPPQPFHPDFES